MCSITAVCWPHFYATGIRYPIPSPSPIMIIATLTPLGDDVLEPIGVDGQLVTNLYERVRPAVVHITTWVITVDFFFGPMPYEGIDSGFVSDKEGHIVTDYHVIKGADTVQVEFSDRLEVPAHVIGIDPPND